MKMMILNSMVILLMAIEASATSKKEDAQSEILEQTNSNDGTGSYNFSFRTSNGIYRTETGQLLDVDSNQKYIVQGSYSYTDPDGNHVVVNYRADENGYIIVKPAEIPPVVAVGVPGPLLASLLGSG